MLTFDLPPSPLLRRRPALLLALEGPPTGGNLDVTCTSRSLQPHAQVKEGLQSTMHEGKKCPDVPRICCACIRHGHNAGFFLSFLDRVHLWRNVVHNADGKSIGGRRSPEMEDFC